MSVLSNEAHAAGLARLIQVPTIATELPALLQMPVKTGPEYFAQFREVLAQLFPLVFEKLELIRPREDALLFKWTGKAHDRPLVFLGHQDVVPADKANWTHPPFAGTIAEGKIWGRGAMDCKNVVYLVLRALEELLEEGVVPEQDVYFGSSDCEEVAGQGAPAIRDYFIEHNIKPAIVLDEGGLILDKLFSFIKKPYAVIGIVEKGFGVIKFTAKSRGGHTTAPPKNTPIERLSRFVVDVHSHNYFKAHFSPEVVQMIEGLAEGVPAPLSFVFRHIKAFAPLVKSALPKLHPMGGGLLKTNITFTMSGGAIVPNMIPNEAYVIANLRYGRYQTVADCRKIFEKLIKKYDLEMEELAVQDATSVVDTGGAGYQYLTQCIRTQFPDVGITPYVIMGGTDGRHFQELSPCSLRFSPVRLTSEQLMTMHGDNENLNVDALGEGVAFFKYFIQNYR
ncbi:MAG: M20/M25/M40 family metallo-hydrolase [Oscillospiraceae bacterium]|jgi:carboxypeptidase PM20D1|nr:M20/M25/M40 family metallo-hydrolase [Oscillospiraceae bacterium]